MRHWPTSQNTETLSSGDQVAKVKLFIVGVGGLLAFTSLFLLLWPFPKHWEKTEKPIFHPGVELCRPITCLTGFVRLSKLRRPLHWTFLSLVESEMVEDKYSPGQEVVCCGALCCAPCLFVCVCWVCSPPSLPAHRRWTMWRKAAVFRTPLPCWCPRRELACSTPRPTVSSPTPPPSWTAVTITRMNTTTMSRWPRVVSSALSAPAMSTCCDVFATYMWSWFTKKREKKGKFRTPWTNQHANRPTFTIFCI